MNSFGGLGYINLKKAHIASQIRIRVIINANMKNFLVLPAK